MAKTLYLRNVPDDVADRLDRLAKQMGMSTSAFAVRELSALSLRADNAALLADLPDLRISTEQIVADIQAGREERDAHLDEVLRSQASERPA